MQPPLCAARLLRTTLCPVGTTTLPFFPFTPRQQHRLSSSLLKPQPQPPSSSSSSSSSTSSSSPSFFDKLAVKAVATRLSWSSPTPANDATWTQILEEAEKVVAVDATGSSYSSSLDPAKLAGRELSGLTENIGRLIDSGHPMLTTINKYYFSKEGKHIRPLVLLLVSQATSVAEKSVPVVLGAEDYRIIDTPLSTTTTTTRPNGGGGDGGWSPTASSQLYAPTVTPDGCVVIPTQRRLAEITEMIHTASLLHDDVIDDSPIRRNRASANDKFGNKMAILAGDFLLARASVALARLRNVEVNELMATVIANLVEGEFMQLKNNDGGGKGVAAFDYYMEKTYMKTASLIAKSCKSATVLSGCAPAVSEIAYEYGKNLGLAFQLVDDMLDFTVTTDDFGKPVGADLKLGLATAPVLFAWEDHPELGDLIDRKFSNEGDVEKAREMVMSSNGPARTKKLAFLHSEKAIAAISRLPPSDARTALIQLTRKVVERVR